MAAALRIFVEDLRLDGELGLLAQPSWLEAPAVLAAVLHSGPNTWDGPEVQAASLRAPGIGGEQAEGVLLAQRGAVPADPSGSLKISIFVRSCPQLPPRPGAPAKASAAEVLVAEALISAECASRELKKIRVEFEWNAKRRLWVGDAKQPEQLQDSPGPGGGDRAGGAPRPRRPQAGPVLTLRLCADSHLRQPAARRGPLAAAEEWVASQKILSQPGAQQPTVDYPCGVSVDVQEVAATLSHRPQSEHEHITQALSASNFLESALETYRACDRDLSGFLTWDSGQVHDFVVQVFWQHGFAPPKEEKIYNVFTRFAGKSGVCLDARECICLVDVLARAILLQMDKKVLPVVSFRAEGELACKSPRVEREQEQAQRQSQRQQESIIDVVGSTALCKLAMDDFDPHGWLTSPVMPKGLGEHSVLEVLNLFLDGVAEQLGIVDGPMQQSPAPAEASPQLSPRFSPKPPKASPKPSPKASPKAALKASPKASPNTPPVVHWDDDWLSVSDTTSAAPSPLTLPLADTSADQGSSNAVNSEQASDALAMAARAAALEAELEDLRAQLKQRELANADLQQNSEELARRAELAEEQSGIAQDALKSLRAEMLAMREKVEKAEEQAEQIVEQIQEASQTCSPSACDERRPYSEVKEVLYCVRTAVRRILLSSWEGPAVLGIPQATTNEVVEAVKREFDWLRQALHTVWDSESLLQDALMEVERTPLAVASLTASGEPPWPEAVVNPRVKEVEELLEALRARAIQPAASEAPTAPPTARRWEVSSPRAAEEHAGTARRRDPSSPRRRDPSSPQPQASRKRSLAAAEQWASARDLQSPPAPLATAQIVQYPGEVSLHLPDFVSLFVAVASANAPRRTEALKAIESKSFLQQVLETYYEFDKDRNGFLTWRSGQIKDFAIAAFRQQGYSPPTEGQIYHLYTRFDVDRATLLEARECLCLVEALFRAVFFTPASISVPSRAQSPGASPAQRWIAGHVTKPIGDVNSVTYPCGVTVDFGELAEFLTPVAAANAAHWGRMVRALESGNVIRMALQIYRAFDPQLQSGLSWDGGEIRDYVMAVFRQHGLSPPMEGQIYMFFAKFAESDMRLEPLECLCLVDALLRSMFHLRNAPRNLQDKNSATQQSSIQRAGTRPLAKCAISRIPRRTPKGDRPPTAPPAAGSGDSGEMCRRAMASSAGDQGVHLLGRSLSPTPNVSARSSAASTFDGGTLAASAAVAVAATATANAVAASQADQIPQRSYQPAPQRSRVARLPSSPPQAAKQAAVQLTNDAGAAAAPPGPVARREAELAVLRSVLARRDAQIQELENILRCSDVTAGSSLQEQAASPLSLPGSAGPSGSHCAALAPPASMATSSGAATPIIGTGAMSPTSPPPSLKSYAHGEFSQATISRSSPCLSVASAGPHVLPLSPPATLKSRTSAATSTGSSVEVLAATVRALSPVSTLPRESSRAAQAVLTSTRRVAAPLTLSPGRSPSRMAGRRRHRAEASLSPEVPSGVRHGQRQDEQIIMGRPAVQLRGRSQSPIDRQPAIARSMSPAPVMGSLLLARGPPRRSPTRRSGSQSARSPSPPACGLTPMHERVR